MAPIYIFILPDYHPQPGVPLLERLAQIDYLGALLSACAFMCVMMGMNFGGVLWAWNDGRSIALFVLAVVIFVVWVFQQVFLFRTTFEYRMFPMHFFRNRTMVLIFIIMCKFDPLLPFIACVSLGSALVRLTNSSSVSVFYFRRFY